MSIVINECLLYHTYSVMCMVSIYDTMYPFLVSIFMWVT